MSDEPTVETVLQRVFAEMEATGLWEGQILGTQVSIARSLAHTMLNHQVVQTRFDPYLSHAKKRALGEIGEQVAGYFKIHVDDNAGLLAAIREREA